MIRRRALPALLLPLPALAQPVAEPRAAALLPAAQMLADEAWRGLEMAAEERPRPVRLLRAEATEPAAALAELRRLVQAERCALVFAGAGTAATLALLQGAEALEAPVVELLSAAEALAERGSRWLVRPGPRAAAFGALAAAALTRALPAALSRPAESWRAALLHEATPSAEALALATEAALRDAGVAVAERLSHAPRGADLPGLARRLRAAGANAVLHAGGEVEAAALLRALADAGWRPDLLLGLGGGWGLAELARAPGIEGVLAVDVPPMRTADAAAPGARPFAEAYQRRYGAAPRSGLSLAAFGAARAALSVPGAGAALRAGLGTLDVAVGALPNGWGWRLDERGQNSRAFPVLLQWQDGRPLTVWPDAAAAAAIRR